MPQLARKMAQDGQNTRHQKYNQAVQQIHLSKVANQIQNLIYSEKEELSGVQNKKIKKIEFPLMELLPKMGNFKTTIFYKIQ